jgi:hypothetical protein
VDVEQFHRGVMACIDTLGRGLPDTGRESHNLQVFTVALAVHLRVSAARCLREGHMTRDQVKSLLQPLLQDLAADSSADNPRD